MSRKAKPTPEDVEAAIKDYDAMLAEEEVREKDRERKIALEKKSARTTGVSKGKSTTATRLEHEKISRKILELSRYKASANFDGESSFNSSARMSDVKR